MRTIYKYPIALSGTLQLLDLPVGAEILTVQTQASVTGVDNICLWAAVNPMAPVETRRFQLYGTGDASLPEACAAKYLGTVQVSAMVFHLFELGQRS